jgi:CIC family chloride channel protein
MVNASDAYAADLDDEAHSKPVGELKQAEDQFLLPSQMVRAALDRFVASELETLAVVASVTDRRVVGFVTESYALRMYNQELERARAEELGDSMLFGPR